MRTPLIPPLCALALAASAHAQNWFAARLDECATRRISLTSVTNATTGEVSTEMHSFIEVRAGLNYLDTSGPSPEWRESQDLIEPTPDWGAAAARGPIQMYCSPDLGAPDAIRVAIRGNPLFKTHPVSVHYVDRGTGKDVQLATVNPSAIAELLPPNQIVWRKAFDSDAVEADFRLTYTRGGIEADLIYTHQLKPPEKCSQTLEPARTELQLRHAFGVSAPPNLVTRELGKGVFDQTLDFDCLLFPTGTAFPLAAREAREAREASVPAKLNAIFDGTEPGAIPVSKSWRETMPGEAILTESVPWLDIAGQMSGLPEISAAKPQKPEVEFASLGPLQPRRVWLAREKYAPRGVVMDYMTVVSSTSDTTFETFTGGNTYYVSSSVSFSRKLKLQPGCVVKYAPGTHVLLTGTLECSGTLGMPSTLTSYEDCMYGETNGISGITVTPTRAASKALWFYSQGGSANIAGLQVRYATNAIRLETEMGCSAPHSVTNTTLEFCNTGLYLAANSCYVNANSIACQVATPVTVTGGCWVYGSFESCRVVSEAVASGAEATTGDNNKNTQSECTFVVADSSTVVAAFFDTHYSQAGLGEGHWSFFPSIQSARSTAWTRSTDGGVTFSSKKPLPPWTNATPLAPWDADGDAGDPWMVYDPGVGGSQGTIYLVANPSREADTWKGLRLWKSTDKGQNFTQVNMNVPGTNFPLVFKADKPALAVVTYPNVTNSHYLYSSAWSGPPTQSLWVTHSSDYGATWSAPAEIDQHAGGPDFAVLTNGTVYVFYSKFSGIDPATNYLRYSWLPPGSTNWQTSTNLVKLNSAVLGRTGKLMRWRGALSDDWFVAPAHPHVKAANGRIYVAYADLPSAGSTNDQGDVFVIECTPDPNGVLSGVTYKVNNETTATDQWDPSIAVNPAGTKLFIGYYSRQQDPGSNQMIRAYGAVASIGTGLSSGAFNCFPVSAAIFPPFFNGSLITADQPGQFDHVWIPAYNTCMDSSAMVTGYEICPAGSSNVGGYGGFCADDYTWAAADSGYFYFAWCDRSATYSSYGMNRPNADIRLARIRQ